MVEHGAVLGDHGVDEVQLPGDAPQLVEDSARDEQDHDPPPPNGGNGLAHLCLENVAPRDRPVEVQGDC
jgi:hypothetical protein